MLAGVALDGTSSLTPHLKRQWLKQDLTTTAKDLEIWLEDSLEEIS